ncbi:S1C family serine protease, partial [Flavobacterium sp.]|uniref:S1C family serine protease n=1 Tax=Flavobacterium sp. TaxID=239 RepID=UPI0037C0D64E
MNIQDRRSILKNLALSGITFSVFNNIPSVHAYTTDEVSQIHLYNKAVSSVGYISTEYKNVAKKLNFTNIGDLPKGVGTGFVWDNQGHIVTNFHVINKVDSAEVTLVNKYGVSKKYMAQLTGADPDKDIAVLKINVSAYDDIHLVPIPLGSNEGIHIGQNAYAIGNPFGQEYTFTVGVISGKKREISSPTGRKIKDMIQTDAAINPGNSGGPLLDSSGRLIGMNTATFGQGVSSGVNFAVSIDTIKHSVNQIIEYGIIQRAVLGISFLERRPFTQSQNNTNNSDFAGVDQGIIILEVPKTSPAYNAGLRGVVNGTLGDVLVGLNSIPVNNTNDLLAALDKYKPGDRVKLHVLRGVAKTRISLDVTLGSFKVQTYSGLEYENRPANSSVPLIP